jgi:hypothetical protein
MIRSSPWSGPVLFWAAIAGWVAVDRAAHGSAADALPIAALLFAAGVLASALLVQLGVAAAPGTTARPPLSAGATRLGSVPVAAMVAAAAGLVLVPVEILVRARSADPWLLVAGRCLAHLVFAFAAVFAVAAAPRQPHAGDSGAQ